MRAVKVEPPEDAWVALKMRAIEERTSLRSLIMDAPRAKGIPIEDADIVADGRHFR